MSTSKIVTKTTLNEISTTCILMRTAFLKCVIVFIFWPYLLHQEVNDCTLLKVNDWVTSHFLYFFTNIFTPSDKKLMPPWSLHKLTFVYWRINCLWYFCNLHPLQSISILNDQLHVLLNIFYHNVIHISG